jgi:hypothetical protein
VAVLLSLVAACSGSSGRSEAERSAQTSSAQTSLLAPTAVATQPQRVLVVGDSLAVAIGVGLEALAAENNLDVRNQGTLGCGILRGTGVRYGRATPTSPFCTAWQERFQSFVDEFQPDLVVVVDGFWDAYDWYIDGVVAPFGSPAWDAFASAEFGTAMDVLTSGGATVAWLESPYFSVEAGDPAVVSYFERTGVYDSAFDDDRVRHVNDVFEDTVAVRDGRVVMGELRHVICPGDDYVNVIDGIEIRGDGVHFTMQGATKVAAWIVSEFLVPTLVGPSCPQPPGPR